DSIRRECGQFRRVSANFNGIGRGPAAVNLHVLADGPARLPQALQKCPDASLKFRIVCCCRQEHADAPYSLLRAPRQRPCRRRAADERDELAALHSITSSARASTLSEILTPSASAVLRLITSSDLVSCSTGRSAGSAPLSTSPVYAPGRRYNSEKFVP